MYILIKGKEKIMPYQNAPESSQNRLGAVSPIEAQLFRDTTEETVDRIWKAVLFGSRGIHGFGELKYKDRLQYIEDKAKIYLHEMMVTVSRSDIDHLVRNCGTIADIDTYFMLLYDCTHFPERVFGKVPKTIKKGVL